MSDVQMPAQGWCPRDYQLPFWKFRRAGGRRAVIVWPRRHGKDHLCLNDMAMASLERVGSYYYILPYQNQARRIVWDGMDKDGKRFRDAWPAELIEKTNEAEMRIHLKNGSVIQVMGGDDPDKLVGANPVGVVFSEYALTDPKCWQLIAPILTENGGWVVFNSTPRGKNHLLSMLNHAKAKEWPPCSRGGWDKAKPDHWYWSHETAASIGVLTPEEMRQLREELKDEQLFQQEVFCSFEAPMQGAYYASAFAKLDRDRRCTKVPVEPRSPIDTAWDLGISDSTCVWFAQRVGLEYRIVNYMEFTGEGLIHTVGEVVRWIREQSAAPGTFWMPHDLAQRELTTGKSRVEVVRGLGVSVRVVPKHAVEDGVEAVRNFLPKCVFDAVKCERGLSCLRSYRKEYDSANQTFRNRPLHDWASHGADAFRYLAMSHREKATVDKEGMPASYLGEERRSASFFNY